MAHGFPFPDPLDQIFVTTSGENRFDGCVILGFLSHAVEQSFLGGYSSSQNHSSREWVPPRGWFPLSEGHVHPFSTSTIMRERVVKNKIGSAWVG